MRNVILIAILCAVSFNVHAERVSMTAQIVQMYSYVDQPGFDGDIAITVANPIAGCEGGFWIRSSDTAGYKNTMAILLSAFHANTPVQFGALNDQIWAGASVKFCRVDQVSISK